MIKETPESKFDPEHPGNRGEFGVDKGSEPIERKTGQSQHIPFDDDKHIGKAAENLGILAPEGSEATEAEILEGPGEFTEPGEVDDGTWIDHQVIHTDGVASKDAHDLLNKVLKETQR